MSDADVIDSLKRDIPRVLEALRALRAEVRDLTTRPPGEPQWRGADPLTSTCNDLALAIMLVGGLPISIPPQNSGRDPDPDTLAADWTRFEESLPMREAGEEPIVLQHDGWRY